MKIKIGVIALLACSEHKKTGNPSSDSAISPAAYCGDGKIEGREECDDGNPDYDDECTPECLNTSPFIEFDSHISEILSAYEIPGASIGVVKDGRLVWVRGYGDAKTGEAMQSFHRGRIASLSKAVTAAAILKLVEEDRLSLDEPAFQLLPHLEPEAGDLDPRLSLITIRQLLTHQGGWDRDVSGDPMFKVVRIASDLGIDSPAPVNDIIRWMRQEPLDFPPGDDYAYSNFGYAVLGRIIEAVSGKSYEEYVNEDLLALAGIDRMEIGRSNLIDRPDDEMNYFPHPGQGNATSVFDGSQTPWPDGGFYLEAMDAHGGWIASVPDILRFVTAVDGRDNREDILSLSSIDDMVTRPNHWGEWQWYGFGWSVRPFGEDQNWWHTGSLPGSISIMVRAYNGFTWAVIANSRPQDSGAFISALDSGVWDALDKVDTWNDETDLFGRLP